ncbi:lithostathine-like [Suncus etruscus]|uniref:lithostathine-like n=1 Tax=Suncus etruscus TaxID=109475 RepID=UPI00211097B2|nr:lithostathine-like [Suncus etruscus]
MMSYNAWETNPPIPNTGYCGTVTKNSGKSNENKQASPENLCPTDTVTYSYYCYSLHTTPASWMEANGHQPSGDGWEWSSNDKLNFSSWERIPLSPYEGYCGGMTKNSGEILEKEEVSGPLNCPIGSVAYYSHCYALLMTPIAWMDASMDCQKRHLGHLVSILSKSEASFVGALIRNSFNNFYDVWIGLHDPTEGRQLNGDGWEWSNGDLMNYSAWEKAPLSDTNFGFCGSVTQSSGFQKWKDYNCDLKLPYICKFRN